MKVYILTYYLNSLVKENREFLTTDLSAFIEEAKKTSDNPYIENIKVYSGEVEEISLKKVLNPF